jgi:hypothetical protein
MEVQTIPGSDAELVHRGVEVACGLAWFALPRTPDHLALGASGPTIPDK